MGDSKERERRADLPEHSATPDPAEDIQQLVERHSHELQAEISKRKRREQELGIERRLLRTVIDLVPDYIYVKDRESRFIVNNLAVAKNLGCAPEEVIGKTDFDFFPKDLAEQFYADEQRVMETGESLISREEANYYPLSNTWGWHLTTTVPLRDGQGKVVGLVGVSRDITSHKQMEETLRESLVHQKVARQVLESQERERKRISAELHDDLGQNLLLAKNKLLLALRAVGQAEAPTEAIHEALSLISQSLQDVRDISHNLRPHLIDELGLSKSIESMVRRLAQSGGLELSTAIEPIDGLLSAEAEINLYRIAQESLNNILKHSEARGISVTLGHQNDQVFLKVSDDGKGFNMDSVRQEGRKECFGLMVMSERAHMLGGELELHSKPGGGTTVSALLPIQGRQNGAQDLGPDR